ncbi:tyrosine/serine/threonine protein phosphatase [Paecilomyces lecythidis]|uniref:protein-tyrosine-phosphatase n=1 Tax=Paecilomyces lecythidis TaxID=3004212 RepID=A0ABR3X7W8_9EURO
MSVFGGISNLRVGRKEESVGTQTLGRRPSRVTVNTSRHFLPFKHRESVSSVTSESADSSPTTTVSTFDSPSATDTSPSSSPESPSSMPFHQKLTSPENAVVPKPAESSEQKRPPESPENAPKRGESPGRRARNLKNLSLKMPAPSSSRPAIATASVMETGSRHLSAPPSPVHPVKTGRRKPANLTIRTPGLDKSFSNGAVPPTPYMRQSLRHIESSPSLQSVFSPSTGPEGGMQLPRPATQHGTRGIPGTWEEGLSPIPSATSQNITSKEVLHDLAEEDDHLDSRESTRKNERGYPDGPICIYDSGVFLYLEPTAEEASKFDVVVNVAKEIPNPFTKQSENNNSIMSTWRNAASESKRQSMVEPQTAFSDISFKSALEYLPADPESASTPKTEQSRPEYIHVGWDHNSEILDDLYPLCELIDDRVSKGKKVLIHCQLGVSRSASLIIAYGLYKNRDLDFNAMYGIVKSRSCWVGPNMSLIYQLTDFRSRVLRGGPSKPIPAEWFIPDIPYRKSAPTPADSSTMQPKPSGSGRETDSGGSAHGEPAAPCSDLGVPKSDTAQKRNVSPRPLPFREGYKAAEASNSCSQSESTRRVELIRFPTVQRDLVMQDAPVTSSVLSPREAGFVANGLSHNVTGNVTVKLPSDSVGLGQEAIDPRSPPQRKEPIIMRNIDEFL